MASDTLTEAFGVHSEMQLAVWSFQLVSNCWVLTYIITGEHV